MKHKHRRSQTGASGVGRTTAPEHLEHAPGNRFGRAEGYVAYDTTGATFHDLVAGLPKRKESMGIALRTALLVGALEDLVKAARAAELQIEDVEVRAQLCFALRPFDDLDMSSPARARKAKREAGLAEASAKALALLHERKGRK